MAFVYLITEEPFDDEQIKNWVKIGYSQNPPEWRMNANLKRGNPRNIFIAAVFEYSSHQEARAAEKAGHAHFRQYLFQKEWFQLDWKCVEKWYVAQGAKPRTVGAISEA